LIRITNTFFFVLQGDNVKSIAVSPSGEARALKDVGLQDEVIEIERSSSVWSEVKKLIEKYNPAKIGINSSERNLSDGLSYTQRIEMEKELGPEISAKLVSADPIVVNWLSVKLPAEIEIMTKAALLTEKIQIEAYKTVIPGKTTDADVARYIKKRMKDYGVGDAWQPDQNPNVNSGVDRGRVFLRPHPQRGQAVGCRGHRLRRGAGLGGGVGDTSYGGGAGLAGSSASL